MRRALLLLVFAVNVCSLAAQASVSIKREGEALVLQRTATVFRHRLRTWSVAVPLREATSPPRPIARRDPIFRHTLVR